MCLAGSGSKYSHVTYIALVNESYIGHVRVRRIEACGSLSVYVSHRTCQFIGSTATKSISVLHSRINHFSG